MSDGSSRAAPKPAAQEGGPAVETAPADGMPGDQGRRSAPGRVPWGPWSGIVYAALIYVAAQVMAELMVSVYPYVHHWNSRVATDWLTNSVVAQFWFVLLAEALTFGAIWLFMHVCRTRLRRIGWQRPRWWDIVLALGGFLVYIVAYVVLVVIAQQVFPSLNVNQKQDIGFQSVSGHDDLLLTFLSLVVLPPVVEETVFRGFIFTGLRGRLRWVWAALITSALFAVPHLLESGGGGLLWVAGIDTFTLSMVLCYLRETSGSLWPGILLHMLKNGIAFVQLFLVR